MADSEIKRARQEGFDLALELAAQLMEDWDNFNYVDAHGELLTRGAAIRELTIEPEPEDHPC